MSTHRRSNHAARPDGRTTGGRRRAAQSGGRRRAAPPPSPGGRGGRGRGSRPPRTGVRRFLPSWKWVVGTLLIVVCGGFAAFAVAYATTTVPGPNPSTKLQSNVFYWSDGTPMATVGSVNRQNVNISQIPDQVKWTFLAAENASFYTDKGIDLKGMARAVYHMATGGEVQSGSTITQQFVKNTMLTQDQSFSRKFKEIMISLKLGSDKKSKDTILQGYLNTSFYGRRAYGIEAAAQAYYKVHASQLTVSQSAFIASTVNQPSTMSRVDTDPAAKKVAEGRWTYVIKRMAIIHKISNAERDKILAAGFPTPKPESSGNGMSGQVGYLVSTASNYVETRGKISEQTFNKGGYQVYTTFDKKKVHQLEKSVADMKKHHLDAKKRKKDGEVQVGAASVDPGTGAIVALYGGAGMEKGHYSNNADSNGVPVGSTFKPFDLASAIDNGAVMSPGAEPSPVTPDSKFNGNPKLTIKDQNGKLIEDKNDPSGYLHQNNDVPTKYGYVSLRYAMQESINTPYVQLGEYTGYKNVETTAMKAGLLRSSLEYNTAGFYIGTSTPSAIRMASAYGTFAAQGLQRDPYSVTKLTHNSKANPAFTKPTAKRAMPSNTANAVNNVLEDVVKKGTGTKAQIGRPMAGKTGTTDDFKSSWFVGYTPDLVTSVSMFREKPGKAGLLSMRGVGGYEKIYGADMPTEVWRNYMKPALAGTSAKTFAPMPNLGKGANESGMPKKPKPSPSPTSSPSDSPSPTPSDSCGPGGQGHGHSGGCNSPTPSITPSPTQSDHSIFPPPSTGSPTPSDGSSGGNGNNGGNGGDKGNGHVWL